MINWKLLGEQSKLDEVQYYIIISGDKGFTADNFYMSAFGDSIESLPAQDIFNMYVQKMLNTVMTRYEKMFVVTGDNRGADTLATDWSLAHDIDVRRYEANWDDNGKRAGFLRNENMFSYVGLHKHKGCILFWDGTDNLTRNLIWLGDMYRVPIRVYNYRACRSLTKAEIEEIQAEERRVQMTYGRF